MIRTLLIANRGEIACRIIRTARRMGIATVAVHSDADAGSLHVKLADRALRIGPAEAARSYLDAGAILAAARASGADAVHPGYGFLSENAGLAQACTDAGLTFVGPPASAIEAMGDKARARRLMVEAGVPVVPGHDGDNQSPGRLAQEAERIGYPLLVKAAAGGGGRGMRKVAGPDELADALAAAGREALAAFGDGSLLLERLVPEARHIEIQIFADRHGNCVHLGERDCSAQRRHQKIVEETPSPFHEPAMCAAMAIDAITAAKAVGYVGAGTVEFIVGADRAYHFLEMNTRLQVEHPVTEMVTGIDLVEWQLRVADGERLPLMQEDIAFTGHAIEARLCAEDAYAGFQPSTGRIGRWRPPERPWLRVDAGVSEGDAVGPHYDPLLAKLVAHGPDRATALERLRTALAEAPMLGLSTNRSFLLRLLDSAPFRAGSVTTATIDEWRDGGAAILAAPPAQADVLALAAAWLALAPGGEWFRSSGVADCPVTLEADGVRREAVVRIRRGVVDSVSIDGEESGLSGFAAGPDFVAATSADRGLRRATVLEAGDGLWLDLDGESFRFVEPDFLAGPAPVRDGRRIVAPVSGVIRQVQVRQGDDVAAGRTICVIEAMKMETPVVATHAGSVVSVACGEGQQVRAGDLLVEIAIGA